MADLSFDDLIPAKAAPAKSAALSFDDLVPSKRAAPKAAPKPSLLDAGLQVIGDTLSPTGAGSRFLNNVTALRDRFDPQPPPAAPKSTPKPVTTKQDMTGGAVSGLMNAAGSMADAVNPQAAVMNLIGKAVGHDPNVRTGGSIAANAGGDYQPQTRAGRYTKVAAEQLPNALQAPVGATGVVSNVLRRGAQVLLPAAASEGARELASAAGAGAKGQAVASVIGAAAGGGAASARAVPKAAAAASLEDTRAAKNAAYAAVDNSGVTYKPQAVDKFVSDLQSTMQNEKLNVSRHPKASSVMSDEIAKLKGTSPTLTELDQLRQVINRDVTSASDASERRLGKIMVKRLDGFIDGAGPNDVNSGSATDAAGMIKSARDLNSRVSKADAVNAATSKAELQAGSTGSGGNLDNATRQKVRSLYEKSKGLTPDEDAAFKAVISGTPVQNAFRQIGKLSPAGNGLMLNLQMLAAIPSGGLSVIPGMIGMGSKAIADNMTKNNVAKLQKVILAGGKAPVAQPMVKNALRRAAPVAMVPAALATMGASRREDGEKRTSAQGR